MTHQAKNEKCLFIPKEQGSLPRVLLLDFEDKTEEVLRDNKFQVFSGMSGFKNGKREFPRDSSEIEIVFWNLSGCDFIKYREGHPHESLMAVHTGPIRDGTPITVTENDISKKSGKSTEKYFDQIEKRGGAICLFLGEGFVNTDKVARFLGYHEGLFSLSQRYNHRIELEKEDDIFYEFFNRFFDEDKIKKIISWRSNFVGVKFYFNDEDNNHYAVFAWNRILIAPPPNNLTTAVLYLLQEILPNICSADIYPDLHKYRWVQDIKDSGFESGDIATIKRKITKLETECAEKVGNLQNGLGEIENSESYLYELLYKDDSSSFAEGNKLKDVVKKVLEEVLEFSDVIDMDSERAKLGLALKEDLRINDNVFIEVKGTEKGAKANWIKDLASHVNDYCCIAKKDINSLKQILVFNHERKKNPLERSEPYEDNPELAESCKATNKLLIPVFELFKLAFDLKNGKIKKENAQNLILNTSGVFKYKMK